MRDLHARFRLLDELPAPYLWNEIEARAVATQRMRGGTYPLALIAAAVLLIAMSWAVGSVGPGGAMPAAQPVPSAISGSPSATPGLAATSAWIATGSLVTSRYGFHTATLLPDGSVLVAGGAAASDSAASRGPIGRSVQSAELLDAATLTWTSTGDMTQARLGHTATLLPDGRVLVAGGAEYDSGSTFRTAELYDPATGIWTATGDMTEPRTRHTATLLSDGRVLVTGGRTDDPFHASAELYDPATGTWTATGDMSQARAAHSATRLSDGRVLVAGGVFGRYRVGPCCGPLSSAELYDPATGTWAATGSMNDLRGGSGATLLPDGRVLVVGEFILSGLVAAELYDAATGSWTPARNMIEPRFDPSSTLLPDGRVLVAGGGQGGSDGPVGVATAELYDPGTGSWTRAPVMQAPRHGHVAVAVTDGRVLVVGGLAGWGIKGGSDVLSDPGAEVFDPDAGS